MGYTSRLDGRLEIKPGVPSDQVPAEFLPGAGRFGPEYEVVFEMGWVEREIDGETFRASRVVAIVPSTDEDWKMYDIEEHLTEVFRSLPPGTSVTGSLVRVGEEQGDIERYTYENGLKIEKATLRWPDGSEVTEARL